MEPQCHPKIRKFNEEADLEVEQDEFFMTGASSCVEVISKSAAGEDCCTANTCWKKHAAPVICDVMERPESSIKAPTPPSFKPTPKPFKIGGAKSALKTQSVEEDAVNVESLMAKVSKENDEKLAEMSLEDIEALKLEVLESVPESFLFRLKQKKSSDNKSLE